MESIQIFEHTINVVSPCTFISDKTSNIMIELNNRFLNKCWNGFYITEILEIVKSSYCRIVSSHSNAMCIINVSFSAKTILYDKGCIISNITICISEGQVCGKGDNINIAFSKSNNNKLLSNGQIIPVVLNDIIQYKPFMERVNALGTLLLPILETEIYYFSEDTKLYINSENNKFVFNDYVTKIKNQENDLKSKNSKFFSNLLYSYDKEIKNSNKEDVDIIDTIERAFKERVDITGYWSKNLANSPDSVMYKKSKTNNNLPFLELSSIESFLEMIKQLYYLRNGIIELGKFYNIKEINPIWDIMKMNKLSTKK